MRFENQMQEQVIFLYARVYKAVLKMVDKLILAYIYGCLLYKNSASIRWTVSTQGL